MAENLNLNGQMDEKIREVADRVKGIRLDMNLTPEEMAGLVDEITAEDVQRIARSVVLDLVYFLHGGAPEEEDEETEEEGEVIDE